jgi:hypothetical protein
MNHSWSQVSQVYSGYNRWVCSRCSLVWRSKKMPTTEDMKKYPSLPSGERVNGDEIVNCDFMLVKNIQDR